VSIFGEDLFASPRSEPAQRLAGFRRRRVELQAALRIADLELAQARDAQESATAGERTAAARAIAFAEDDTAAARKTKITADKRLEASKSKAEALRAAVAEIDAETLRTAREHAPELLDEVLADHDAAAARADQAAAQLRAARADMREAFRAAMTLTGVIGDRETSRRLIEPAAVERLAVDGASPLLPDRPRSASPMGDDEPEQDHGFHYEEVA
jgi:hypothetical protein